MHEHDRQTCMVTLTQYAKLISEMSLNNAHAKIRKLNSDCEKTIRRLNDIT